MGQWIKDKICGFADGIIDGFKSVFGISSPSKVMRDSVGRYLAEGIGEGFMDELPSIAEEAREALTNLDFKAPEVDLDAAVSLSQVPKLEISVPDIPKPEIPAIAISGVDNEQPFPISQPAITNDAIAAMDVQQQIIDRTDTVPSATSDIYNNQYIYNNTVNNSGQQSSEPQPIALTAQFIVGEEIVAEGVLDIVDEAIDERQGLRATIPASMSKFSTRVFITKSFSCQYILIL